MTCLPLLKKLDFDDWELLNLFLLFSLELVPNIESLFLLLENLLFLFELKLLRLLCSWMLGLGLNLDSGRLVVVVVAVLCVLRELLNLDLVLVRGGVVVGASVVLVLNLDLDLVRELRRRVLLSGTLSEGACLLKASCCLGVLLEEGEELLTELLEG